MPQNFIIPLIVYPFDVMVSVGESDTTLFKKLERIGICVDDLFLANYAKNGQGRYCLFEGGQTLIRIKGKPKSPEDWGFLQHEIFHATTTLLDSVGMKLIIQKSDEAYAYLVGYLTIEIYKRL